MAVRLVFLGKLADLAGSSQLELAAPVDWTGLLQAFAWLDDGKVKLALNGALLADREALLARDGDEIALLPPVSGG